MRFRFSPKRLTQRAAWLLASISILAGAALPVAAPFFIDQAAAAGSPITPPLVYGDGNNHYDAANGTGTLMPQDFTRGGQNLSSVKGIHSVSCVATFVQEPLDASHVHAALGETVGELQADNAQYGSYVSSHLGQTVGIIVFSDAGDSAYPDKCPGFTLIPVSGTRFYGMQFTDPQVTGMMTFNLTGGANGGADSTGSLTYYTQVKDGGSNTTGHAAQRTSTITVGGIPTGTTSINSGSLSNAQFADVAHITATYTLKGQAFSETYTDPRWDDQNTYFLTSTDEPGRQQLIGSSHVPYIRMLPDSSYNFSQTGGNAAAISHMQTGMNALAGSSTAHFFDFNGNGGTVGSSGNGVPGDQSISVGRTNARVWFFYSPTNKALISVFQNGSGNEQPYLGNYALASGSQYYDHAGECANIGRIVIPQSTAGNIIPVDWTLYVTGTSCQSSWGTLQVDALADDSKYTAAANAASTNSSNSTSNAGQLTCDLNFNPLTWIACPLVTAAQAGADQLNKGIDNMMNVDVNLYFNQKDNGTGQSFYAAWSSFRVVALAIVVVAGLIMVISQAAGWEVIDAYTIKKMMPRLVISVVAIALSWELCKLFITFCDVLGFAVRNLIYTPFSHGVSGANGAATHFELGNGASAVLTLIGGGAWLTLGLFGLLSLALTAFLAVATAFVFLVLRLGLIFFLVIVAPLAIACSILPNTQKLFKMWWSAFRDMGLAFAAISAAIALGRVLAYVNYTGSNAGSGNNGLTGLVLQLLAVVFYFGVYFLIPVIFRMIGGFVGTLSGFVNDRSKGAFDRLKKYRAEQPGKRSKRFTEGEFFNQTLLNEKRRGPLGAIARFGNRQGRRVGAGMQGNFGFGQTGHQYEGMAELAQAQETARNNPLLSQLQNNDDGNAVLGLSGGTKAGAMQAARQLFGNDEKRISDAYNAANAVGFKRQNAMVAIQTMAQSKSRAVGAGDWGTVQSGIDRLAEGNDALAANLRFGYQYNSRNSGRADLGGDWLNSNLIGRSQHLAQRTGISEHEARSHELMLDGFGRTPIQKIVDGHTSGVKQAAKTVEFMLQHGNVGEKQVAALRAFEMQRTMAPAPGDNQKAINAMLDNLHIDTTMAGTGIAQQLVDRANEGLPQGQRAFADTNDFTTRARTFDQEQAALAAQQQAYAQGSQGGGGGTLNMNPEK